MPRIICNPKIQGGEPILEGTRVTVKTVLEYLSNGIDINELSQRYQNNGLDISEEDIKVMLLYASERIGKKNEK